MTDRTLKIIRAIAAGESVYEKEAVRTILMGFFGEVLYETDLKEWAQKFLQPIKISGPYLRGTEKSVGFDCYSQEDKIIQPFGVSKIRLGIFSSWEDRSIIVVLKERSGLASKGIRIGGGVIDGDFAGEWCAIVQNLSNDPFQVIQGMKICQFLILRGMHLDSLSTTVRTGGFGSTD